MEALSGGYYEPILPMIHDADKVGQIRKLTEYIGDSRKPDGFKPPREEADTLAGAGSGGDGLQEFGMEGYQESPSAWIDDWCIRAKSFKLRLR